MRECGRDLSQGPARQTGRGSRCGLGVKALHVHMVMRCMEARSGERHCPMHEQWGSDMQCEMPPPRFDLSRQSELLCCQSCWSRIRLTASLRTSATVFQFGKIVSGSSQFGHPGPHEPKSSITGTAAAMFPGAMPAPEALVRSSNDELLVRISSLLLRGSFMLPRETLRRSSKTQQEAGAA